MLQSIVATAPVLLLGGAFLALATPDATIHAVLAGSARDAVKDPTINRTAHRSGGGLMIGARIWMAPECAA